MPEPSRQDDPVTVYYNPRKPTEAALINGSDALRRGGGLVSLAFLGVPVLMLLLTVINHPRDGAAR